MSRQEFGDWQTPLELAEAVMSRVAQLHGPGPSIVVEPTCGEGSFLIAASRRFKTASLLGYELLDSYADSARAKLPEARSTVTAADFFSVDWDKEIRATHGPLLVAGNLPWVTSATLGVLGSENLPTKSNFKGLSGFEALTGKSNFDVSEWMILRLLAAMQGRKAMLAMLCKTAVARRVIEFSSAKAWDVRPGGLWRIDAMQHFKAAVDAVLFVCEIGSTKKSALWPVYDSLESPHPAMTMTIADGSMIADADKHERTLHLAGRSDPAWRSGIKHDCSRVMELRLTSRGKWENGLGEAVHVEDESVFFMLKSSDVANGRTASNRAVIVTQRKIGDDTTVLRRTAPKTWEYLTKHEELLSARKSSIYRGQPPFAIFGVGPYSFAPWKVAISGLYKRCVFSLVGPQCGRPVMFDDTCYFLSFNDEHAARAAHEALSSDVARSFFSARVFWDAKRPFSKQILQQLDLDALLSELQLDTVTPTRQMRLAL